MKFIRFIHKLFKPNCICSICSAPRCELCEELKLILDKERYDKKNLVNALIHNNTFGEEPYLPEINVDRKPIGTSIVNWETRRRQLEANDRTEATKRRAQQEQTRADAGAGDKAAIEELEKSLGIIADKETKNG